jgi:hypothetical protein
MVRSGTHHGAPIRTVFRETIPAIIVRVQFAPPAYEDRIVRRSKESERNRPARYGSDAVARCVEIIASATSEIPLHRRAPVARLFCVNAQTVPAAHVR